MASVDGSSIVMSENARLRTLVLKAQAEEMRDNLEATVEARVVSFRETCQADISDEELGGFIDASFGAVEREVMSQLANMKEEVKSHAPKRPVRKPEESDEQFQEALSNYKNEKSDYMNYVGYVTSFLQGLAGLFRDIFISIREFFKSLWTWIKQALKNVAKKVSDFIRFLKEKISRGIEALLA